MGGIGFLIKKHLYLEYDIKCTDSQNEGILCQSIKHKISGFHVIVIGCYLPPDNSFHGRNGDMYFDYLTILYYQYIELSDMICYMW